MTGRVAAAIRALCAATLFAAAVARAAAAQTIGCTADPLTTGQCTTSASVTLRTNLVLQLTLSAGGTTLTMPPGNAFDLSGLDTSFTAGPTVTVVSSVPWSLQIASSTTSWTVVPALPAPKPASDMTYTWAGPVASSGSAVGLSTTATTVTQSTSQGRLPQVAIGLAYAAIWSIATDGPGTYSMTIVFSMTAP